MTPIDVFTLRPAGGTAASELLEREQPTGVLIPGRVLDAQFASAHGVLLLTTEDSPYEEVLHAVLIGPGGAVLDALDLGHRFAAGILTDLRTTGTDSLEFSFFGGDLWELTIAPERRWLRPREAPLGVRRRLRRLLAPRLLALERVH